MSPAGGEAEQATLEALEQQTAELAEVVIGADPRAALAHGTEWIWLVDGSVLPQASALAELLEALERWKGLAPPVLLASRIVTPDGALDRGSAPVVKDRDRELAVSAFQRRLVPLRVARRGSLLVHRRALEPAGAPRPGSARWGGDLVWTARLLEREPGLLVPASVVVRRPDGARPAWSELGGQLRLLCSRALAASEKPWFAFQLAEAAVLSARAARRAGRAGSPQR